MSVILNIDNIKNLKEKVNEFFETGAWFSGVVVKIHNDINVEFNNKEEYLKALDELRQLNESGLKEIQQSFALMFNTFFNYWENNKLVFLLSDNLINKINNNENISMDELFKNINSVDISTHIENEDFRDLLRNLTDVNFNITLNDILEKKVEIDDKRKHWEENLYEYKKIINNLSCLPFSYKQKEALWGFSNLLFLRENIGENTSLAKDAISNYIYEIIKNTDNLSENELEKLIADKDNFWTYLLNKKCKTEDEINEVRKCIKIFAKDLFKGDNYKNKYKDYEVLSVYFLIAKKEKYCINNALIEEGFKYIVENGNIDNFKTYLKNENWDVYNHLLLKYENYLIDKKLNEESIKDLFLFKKTPSIVYDIDIKDIKEIFKNMFDVNNDDTYFIENSKSFNIYQDKNKLSFQFKSEEIINLDEDIHKEIINTILLKMRENQMANIKATSYEGVIREYLLQKNLNGEKQNKTRKKV